MDQGAILAINAGSSSIKFALFAGVVLARACHGQIEGIGAAPRFRAEDGAGVVLAETTYPPGTTHEALLGGLLDFVTAHQGGVALHAVGHRVVHGGTTFDRPVQVDAAVLVQLDALTPLAPRRGRGSRRWRASIPRSTARCRRSPRISRC